MSNTERNREILLSDQIWVHLDPVLSLVDAEADDLLGITSLEDGQVMDLLAVVVVTAGEDEDLRMSMQRTVKDNFIERREMNGMDALLLWGRRYRKRVPKEYEEKVEAYFEKEFNQKDE
jgi:hypothetical protein